MSRTTDLIYSYAFKTHVCTHTQRKQKEKGNVRILCLIGQKCFTICLFLCFHRHPCKL